MNKDSEVLEILDKLEEYAYAMKDLPMSNWIDLAENEAELDLKIMDWVETIKSELLKGKQSLQRLEAIDNANPSKALECSLKLYKMVESAGNDKGFNLNEAWEYHKTIKQALFELKAIKDANPSESLDKLEKVIEEITISNADLRNTLKTSVLIASVKQALLKAQEQEKILNIILKKRIDLESFYSTFVKDNLDYKYYEKYYGTYGLEKLTQEEFELLKEVFG